MSITYTIKDKLVVVTAHGSSSYGEIFKAFGKIITDPAFKTPTNVLFDARHTDYNLPTNEIEALADQLGKFKSYYQGRWAMVADPNSLVYGLLHMFCRFSELEGLCIESFSDYDAAYAWLLECDFESVEDPNDSPY